MAALLLHPLPQYSVIKNNWILQYAAVSTLEVFFVIMDLVEVEVIEIVHFLVPFSATSLYPYG
jgi:hypothetical protein